MDSFGQIFRLTIYGESHSNGLGVVLDNVLPGIAITSSDFIKDLKERAPKTKYETARLEDDTPEIVSGVFEGKTTGAPINIFVKNTNIDSSYYKEFLQNPRSGHADTVARIKYKGFNDYRGSGQFSGRMTVAIVLAGVVARKIVSKFNSGVTVKSTLSSLAGSTDIEKVLKTAYESKQTVGGIVNTVIKNVPRGLGEPFFDSFESVLSHLAFSIPGVKGIDFDNAFTKDLYGESFNADSSINGGLTNGRDITFNLLVKPPSSNPSNSRFDTSFATRVPVISTAIANIVLADFFMRDTKWKV